jgi:membrane protease YdiL (CAAX protease family)
LHPPSTPEAVAALVVFPLGEEFGWRGFAYPRLVARFGAVRGALLLGLGWALWHLAYSVTPERAAFDAVGFLLTLLELPLFSVILAWLFERADRSLAVALAFHAGAHLDHFEPAIRNDPRLQVAFFIVLVVTAAGAAWALRRRPVAEKTV